MLRLNRARSGTEMRASATEALTGTLHRAASMARHSPLTGGAAESTTLRLFMDGGSVEAVTPGSFVCWCWALLVRRNGSGVIARLTPLGRRWPERFGRCVSADTMPGVVSSRYGLRIWGAVAVSRHTQCVDASSGHCKGVGGPPVCGGNELRGNSFHRRR